MFAGRVVCQVVAHRGASRARHENTLAAFELAITFGADYVELDVRKTGDGCLVVHHDPDVHGVLIAGNPLKTLQRQAGEHDYSLATLEEVLIKCRDRIKLNLELKEEGYEESVLRVTKEFLVDRDFVITSFSDESLQRTKNAFADVRCGLLLGRSHPPRRFRTRCSEFFPVRRARRCGANFVLPHFELLRLGFTRRLQLAGFPIWVWTVDDPDLMRKLLQNAALEAIITNVPDVALAIRAALP